jgi:hypothetical protein
MDTTNLAMQPFTLAFKSAQVEGEFLGEVAQKRWPVLIFIFCFDVLCFLFRFTAKLSSTTGNSDGEGSGMMTPSAAVSQHSSCQRQGVHSLMQLKLQLQLQQQQWCDWGFIATKVSRSIPDSPCTTVRYTFSSSACLSCTTTLFVWVPSSLIAPGGHSRTSNSLMLQAAASGAPTLEACLHQSLQSTAAAHTVMMAAASMWTCLSDILAHVTQHLQQAVPINRACCLPLLLSPVPVLQLLFTRLMLSKRWATSWPTWPCCMCS